VVLASLTMVRCFFEQDMGMSHSNTLGGQNCVKTFDDGKSW